MSVRVFDCLLLCLWPRQSPPYDASSFHAACHCCWNRQEGTTDTEKAQRPWHVVAATAVFACHLHCHLLLFACHLHCHPILCSSMPCLLAMCALLPLPCSSNCHFAKSSTHNKPSARTRCLHSTNVSKAAYHDTSAPRMLPETA